MTNKEHQYHFIDQDIKDLSWGNIDFDWSPPSDFPDLTKASRIAVDLETRDPNLIKLASEKFGSQCLVLGVDFKEVEKDKFIVFSKSGKINTNLHVFEWIKKCEELGVGEIMLTDIDRDGTYKGLNLNIVNKVSEFLKVPLIISGGCGLASHFVEGFNNLKIDAISAGSFFAKKDQNIFQLRSQILNSGINLRQI